MEFHSFLTFFLNSLPLFCRCISFTCLSSQAHKDPFLPLWWQSTEPCKAGRKSGWWSSGWVVVGLISPTLLLPVSLLYFAVRGTLQPSRNFWPDYSHLNHLERLCKIILCGKKSSFQFGVEISIMLRDTVLPTAVRM